jgi:hypothetical protein
MQNKKKFKNRKDKSKEEKIEKKELKIFHKEIKSEEFTFRVCIDNARSEMILITVTGTQQWQ